MEENCVYYRSRVLGSMITPIIKGGREVNVSIAVEGVKVGDDIVIEIKA